MLIESLAQKTKLALMTVLATIFTYYGTQLIKRRTRDLKRSMVTTGYIESVPRTRNNPHGLMITNWRTLENKDLDY